MAITSTLISNTTTTQLFLSSGDNAITTIMLCNNSDVAGTELDVYVVGNGDVVTSRTRVLKSLPLPADETFVFDAEKLILENGDAIYAQATVDLIVSASVSSVSI